MELASSLFTTQINNSKHVGSSCNTVSTFDVNNTTVLLCHNRLPNARLRNRNELQRIFPYHLFNKFTATLTDENVNSKLNIRHYVNSSESYIDEHQLLLERLSHKYKSQFHYGKHFFEKFAVIAKNNTKLFSQHKHAVNNANVDTSVNNANKGKKKQGRFFNMIFNLVNNKTKRNKRIKPYMQCNSNSNKQRVIKMPQLNVNRNVNCDRNVSVQKKRMSSLPLHNTLSDELHTRNDKQMEYFTLGSSNYASRNKQGGVVFDNKGSNYISLSNSAGLQRKDKRRKVHCTTKYNEGNPKQCSSSSSSSNNKCRNWKRSMLSLNIGDNGMSSFSPLSST